MKKKEAGTGKHRADAKLLAYAAAAGAALAVAAPADATIIYTSKDVTLTGSNFAGVDIDGNAVNEFRFWHTGVGVHNWGSIFQPLASTQAANPARFAATGPGSPPDIAINFGQGALVSSGLNWAAQGLLFWAYQNTIFSGQFAAPDGGYIGIKFDPGSGDKFGWVHVDSVASDYSSYHIAGWAYEDSGSAIMAGAGEPTSPIPVPPTLVLLASGAAGLGFLRRSRKKPEAENTD